jgi:hypothetical protein
MTAPNDVAGFNAETAVSELSYLIPERFGGDGQKHLIPEPSSEQVAQFWFDYRNVALAQLKARTTAPEDETDEQRDARLETEIMQGHHQSLETLAARIKIVAALCSDCPSAEELGNLPHRVMNAFEAYLIGAISPQA